jgi:hypothetical protein
MTDIEYTPDPLTADQRRGTVECLFNRMFREAVQQDAAERNRAAREAEALSRAAQGRECK